MLNAAYYSNMRRHWINPKPILEKEVPNLKDMWKEGMLKIVPYDYFKFKEQWHFVYKPVYAKYSYWIAYSIWDIPEDRNGILILPKVILTKKFDLTFSH